MFQNKMHKVRGSNFGSWTEPWRNLHATAWYLRYRNEFPNVDFSDLYYWIFCNQFNGVTSKKPRSKQMRMSKKYVDETKSKTHGATIVSTASSEESTDCMADSLSEIFKNIAKNAGTGPYLNIEGSDLAKLLDNNMIHVEETLPGYLRTELGKVSDEDGWVSIGEAEKLLERMRYVMSHLSVRKAGGQSKHEILALSTHLTHPILVCTELEVIEDAREPTTKV